MKKAFYPLLIVLLAAATSCVYPFELEQEATRELLVIDGDIVPGSSSEITLSYVSPLTNDLSTPVRRPLTAVVRLEVDRAKSEGVRLYCYPNGSAEDRLGAPATKLVVEGVRSGVPLRREAPVGGPDGIRRGSRYRLSVRLSDGPQTGSMTLYPGQFLTGRDGEQLRVWVEVTPEDTPVYFDREDLEFDRERGIYDYTLDADGKGVTLDLLQGGTGMFIVSAGPPVSQQLLVVVVVNP